MRGIKILLGLLVTASVAAAQPASDVTPQEFERLHKDIRPRSGESPWAAIPWTYDLHKARKKAAEEGKPLCVWRMAGDPTAVCWQGGFGARAAYFANASVVKQIKEQCVPVVVGFYDETSAYAPDAADTFFKRMSETSDNPGKPFYMPNGTPFFCTASGTLLKKGLSEWEKLPESERKPGAIQVPDPKADPTRAEKDRRLTKPPANALILRTYVRGLKLDEDKRLFAPKVIDWDYNQKLPAEPNRDFLWLQEAEWKALIPGRPVKGQTVAVLDAVRDRICHWHIAGGYHGLLGYYTADHFQSKEMTLSVEEATPQGVTLRLTGAARLKTEVSYRFHGVLHYDAKKKAFTRFDLIALCDEAAEPKKKPQNVAPFRYYGVAFELPGERTDDLLPPFYLRENVGTPATYFANTVR